jgi:hypothetical protein
MSFKEIFNASRKGQPEEESPSVSTPPKRGESVRTVGKRSQGDYTQVSAYVRTQTHRNVKIALLQDGAHEDFSELVERLLAEWLSARGGETTVPETVARRPAARGVKE